MALLDLVQNVCNDLGLQPPDIAIGNTDAQIIQLIQLANKEGRDLSRRYQWQAIINEATFTTVATESQGDVSEIAPGYRYILNDTIWNRSQRRPVIGPINPRNWQMLQASPVTGPYDQYRIRGGEILFDPTPTAGETCAFEYVSSYWCESATGDGQDTLQADTDVTILDQMLIELGVIWRWNQRKGFDYAEDYQTYENQVVDSMGRDGTKPRISLNGGIDNYQPGVFVPQTGFGQ